MGRSYTKPQDAAGKRRAAEAGRSTRTHLNPGAGGRLLLLLGCLPGEGDRYGPYIVVKSPWGRHFESFPLIFLES